jgi:cell division protein FtsZ
VTQPAASQAEQPKSRFGLNGLLGRMTGGTPAPEPSLKEALQADRTRRQPHLEEPPMSAGESEDDEQDRIEIPAFLRRQAN